MANPLDREQVERLYRAYGAQVERICRKFLSDPTEVADVTQEVFLTLIESGGDFRGESQWMTYLYKITKHKCLSRSSKAEGRRALLARHGDAVRPGAMFDPAVLLDRDILYALLAHEDGKTQEMVVYCHILGMSLREVGELMGMSHTAVRQCLDKFGQRAQAYLRKASRSSHEPRIA